MVSRRTRVVSWIFRRDHPSRPNAMICCFFSSFKTFAMLREATYPPAAVNVLDVSSESMAAFQVFLYGRFWVFTEGIGGFSTTLKSVGVLLKLTTDASKFFAGNLGIDLLQQAHKTTFDFRAMTLTLQ